MTGGRAAGMSAEMCSKMNFNDGLEFRSLQRTGVTRRLSTDTPFSLTLNPGFFRDTVPVVEGQIR